MKKQISIVLGALTLLATQSYCAAALLAKTDTDVAQDLIIILDAHNNENPQSRGTTPMTQRLCTALIQKAAPIIASPSLVHNIATRAQTFASSPLLTGLVTKPQETLKALKSEDEISFICYATKTNFKEKEWIISKIQNIAYIFIPVTYLNTKLSKKIILPMEEDSGQTIFACYGKKNRMLKFRQTNMEVNVSKGELLTGLKYAHYPSVTNPFTPSDAMNDIKQVESAQESAMQNFDWTELFITRKDLGLSATKPLPGEAPPDPAEYQLYQAQLLEKYKKITGDKDATIEVFEQYMFPWFILMAGHGSPEENGLIANLTVPQFKNFLAFLNGSIKTIFFFYSSCYAGGQHTDPTFKFANKAKTPLNLNFTVAVGALTDQSTIGGYLEIDLPTAKPLYSFAKKGTESIMIKGIELKPFYITNFNTFFAGLHQYFMGTIDAKTIKEAQKTTLPDIINTVHNFKDYTISNTPLIRFPNTEWFKATDISNAADIINRQVIQNYLQKKITAFEVNKKTLLVYEPYIPLPVIIKYNITGWNKNLSIVPMNTKEKFYFFENVKKVDPVALADIFRPFTPFKTIPSFQMFDIRNLLITLKENSNIPGELGKPQYKNKEIVLEKVRIVQLVSLMTLNFTFAGIPYEAEFKDYDTFMPSLKVLTDAQKIEKYEKEFSTYANVSLWEFNEKIGLPTQTAETFPGAQQTVASLRQQYDSLKKSGPRALQEWKKTLPKNLQIIVDSFDGQAPLEQKKPIPSTPTATGELLQALNSLSSALNNLKDTIK